MKKQILALMVSAAVFAMNPAFGMDGDGKDDTPQGPTRQIPSKADAEKTIEKLRSVQVFIERFFKSVHYGYGDISWEDIKEDLEIDGVFSKICHQASEDWQSTLNTAPIGKEDSSQKEEDSSSNSYHDDVD